MQRSIASVLKARAREQGLTQGQVARMAQVSLPTARRWFAGQGLDLERLGVLLKILDLSLSELAAQVEASQGLEFELSHEQEEAMAKEPLLLAGLHRLLKGKRAMLKPRQLRSLENLGLLERHRGDRIKLLVRGQMRWRTEGPLAKTLKRRALDEFLSPGRLSSVRLVMTEVNSDDYKRLETILLEARSFVRSAQSRAQAFPSRPVAIGVLVGLAPFKWSLLER